MLLEQTSTIIADSVASTLLTNPSDNSFEAPFTSSVTDASSADDHNDDAPEAFPSIDEVYTIAEDGHFIGADGFNVPRNAHEFFQRFPNHVRSFVDRHMMWHSVADREDRTSELQIFLLSLPPVSKFREPGYNGLPNGCTDRIQVFHPDNAHGASKPRFLAFINYMLLNAFISLMKKQGSNPIERVTNLPYFHTQVSGEGERVYVDDDYLHKLIPDCFVQTMYACWVMEDSIMYDEVCAFISAHNPDLMPVFKAISSCGSFVDAQRLLGMSEQLFTRARNRLRRLMECYGEGTTPPRQRKIYRPRASKRTPTIVSAQKRHA